MLRKRDENFIKLSKYVHGIGAFVLMLVLTGLKGSTVFRAAIPTFIAFFCATGLIIEVAWHKCSTWEAVSKNAGQVLLVQIAPTLLLILVLQSYQPDIGYLGMVFLMLFQ